MFFPHVAAALRRYDPGRVLAGFDHRDEDFSFGAEDEERLVEVSGIGGDSQRSGLFEGGGDSKN
jgi:hypothetical protein